MIIKLKLQVLTAVNFVLCLKPFYPGLLWYNRDFAGGFLVKWFLHSLEIQSVVILQGSKYCRPYFVPYPVYTTPTRLTSHVDWNWRKAKRASKFPFEWFYLAFSNAAKKNCYGNQHYFQPMSSLWETTSPQYRYNPVILHYTCRSFIQLVHVIV